MAPRKNTLAKLIARDGAKCRYCGVEVSLQRPGVRTPEDATIDHVIARGRGGTNAMDNLVIACRECNEAKGDGPPPRSMRAWLDSLTTVRRVPDVRALLTDIPPQIIPIEDSVYILKHGKKAWRKMRSKASSSNG